MKIDVAADVAACLENAPGGDAGADQVNAWLFTRQNCVAVRLRRIVEDEDKAARELLTEAAGRTWRRVTDPEGEAQRLWREISEVAQYFLENQEVFGDFIHDQSRGRATCCLESTSGLLAIPEDLIGPGPAWGIPHRQELAKWLLSQAERGDPMVIAPPVLGDFCAVNVLNRLHWLTREARALGAAVVKGKELPSLPGFASNVKELRSELWDSPDAAEAGSACILVQVYLAWHDSPEDGWQLLPTVLPDSVTVALDPIWPTGSEDLASVLELNPGVQADACRRHFFRRVLESRLRDCPGEVAKIVKGGLEWLLKALCKVSKRPKCQCGGRLRPDERRPNVLTCAECGTPYAAKRNPANPAGQATYEAHVYDQLHPGKWAIDILNRIDKLAKGPGAASLFQGHMEAVAASLVQEREAREAGTPWPRQRPMGSPGWLLTHCPKSLRGLANAPLPPWRYFVLASFHNGICEGQDMAPILPSGWPVISLEGPNMPSKYPGTAPESAPDDDLVSQTQAFFASPEFQQWHEYEPYADRPVGEWERDKATLARYIEDVAADLDGCLQKEPGETETPPEKADQYVFCRNGEIWQLVFEGKEKNMKDSKGLGYLAYLLSKPERPIGVNELYLAVNPLPGMDNAAWKKTEALGQTTPEALEEAGMTKSGLNDSEEVISAETKRALEYKLGQLEKKKAREDIDPADAAVIGEEIEQIEGYLRSASGLNKRIRKMPSVLEKKRKAILNCIKDAIDKIEKHHESLGRHLSNAVSTGLVCTYKPDRPIPWVT